MKKPSTRVLGVQLGGKKTIFGSCLDSNPWKVMRPF